MKIEFSYSAIGYKTALFTIDNLVLETGKTYALMGKNGCGKTTLLQTLLGEQKLLGGTIQIDRTAIQALNAKEKTKYLSFVPSKFNGVQHLSVKDLIALGRAPFTNVLGKLSKQDNQRINEILNLLNLENLQQKSTHLISDGERQKAMIGKALAQEAAVIVLDEPTAFLDYSNRLKTIELLNKLAKEENKLVLFSSHNVDLAFEYCDVILAVDNEGKFNSYHPETTQKEVFIKKVY
ncbi:MAG: ABC transporter ATP-binding protein [Lishizhenia sp.]